MRNTSPGVPSLGLDKRVFWVSALLGLVADQWTKNAAFAHHFAKQGTLAKDRALQVIESGWLSVEFVREYNPGMAFGWMQDLPAAPIVLAIMRSVAIIFFLWLLRRTPAHQWNLQLALAALVAGTGGNLTDNLLNGDPGHEHAVRDFLLVRCSSWHLPAFNLADCLVAAGGSALLFLLLRDYLRSSRSRGVASPDAQSR